ncbi:MAG TPA: FHA domain-containing protein [Actinomycetota bacterium]|jgi:pSer/pThr/pTyr-binding forkhead associated (FHA) protein
MPDIVLSVLKYLFLSLIFLFLARAVHVMYLEIGGPRTVRGVRSVARSPAAPMLKPGKAPDRLAVTAHDGSKPRTFSLDEELLIGRATKCRVVITDPYASQVHARVFRRDGTYYIEDMGSTNGTYLNRKKVTSATPVARGDKARIGKTELEFRR